MQTAELETPASGPRTVRKKPKAKKRKANVARTSSQSSKANLEAIDAKARNDRKSFVKVRVRRGRSVVHDGETYIGGTKKDTFQCMRSERDRLRACGAVNDADTSDAEFFGKVPELPGAKISEEADDE